ncbi:hypothetical protein OAY10_02685 [Acidimicrobiaceae bacterium]|nr:hypothetical protein [Acidimicrobiaceae bacterium]
MKNNLKVLTITFFSIVVVYFIDFYFLENYYNQQFWCVEIIKDFKIYNLNNIRLPIHCDEGPYQFAITSIDNFFNETNPYQGRPLFILILSSFNNLFSFVNFLNLSSYEIYKLSMLIVQVSIIFLIIKIFISLMKIKSFDNREYLLILLLISIPSLRWNIFLASVGNLPFLLFLISLDYLMRGNFQKKDTTNIFLLYGLFSLAHLSSIIYGLIILFYIFINQKKIQFKDVFLNLIFLLGFQSFYRFIIYLSPYDYFDWNRDVYNQFYWILSAFDPENSANCQTLSTFLKCNNVVTFSYIGYFSILIFYFFCMTVLINYLKIDIPKIIKLSLYINFVIFIFWSLQGLYEPFRFVNYSIGYFFFFSCIVYVFTFRKDITLIFSLLFYNFSIYYLEPYNTALDSPQINVLTVISFLTFLMFVFKQSTTNFQKKDN